MAVSSVGELMAALGARNAEAVLETPESDRIEFKRQPYNLALEKDKWELAKDCTALRNARGGVIVLGVEATAQPYDTEERASKLRPFPKERLNVDQLRKSLRDMTRPPMNPTMNWFPAHDDDAEDAPHYFVIEVEPLPPDERYGLIRKTAGPDGSLVEAFAAPVRDGDSVQWISVDDAYRLVNDGLYGRLTRVEQGNRPDADPIALAAQALTDLESAEGWLEDPVVYWQSWPEHPGEVLPQLHDRDGIRGVLDGPDRLRPDGGFNFRSYNAVEIRAGGLLVGSRRRALWVRPDGVVTAGVPATSDSLAWAMPGADNGNLPLRINVVALTEYTLEYFRFVDREVIPRLGGRWMHAVRARRMLGERPVELGLGPPHLLWMDYSHASADSWDRTFRAEGEIAVDSFRAIESIYMLFGRAVGDNPYVTDGRLDPATFLERVERR